jgi:hypothetical protein
MSSILRQKINSELEQLPPKKLARVFRYIQAIKAAGEDGEIDILSLSHDEDLIRQVRKSRIEKSQDLGLSGMEGLEYLQQMITKYEQ